MDDELKGRVQQLATARQRTAHWIMREAIAQYVSREEARESFLKEALESWTEFQETGRHITGEEARAWLASWGSEAETPCPRATSNHHGRCRARPCAVSGLSGKQEPARGGARWPFDRTAICLA